MLTTTIKEKIIANVLDEVFRKLYLDETVLDYQKARYIKAIEKFEELYGVSDVNIISVPGRSEVGGNHTDHQHGKVLAASVNVDIIGVVSKARNVSLVSDERKVNGIRLDDLKLNDRDGRSTRSLVRGVLKRLEDEYYRIGGFNGFLTSDVPVGSGMSSSAAFEVMIGNIISVLYNRGEIDPVVIAKASQYSENVYFGKPCGLMDQMACSVGGLVNIDFENEKKPIVKKVNVEFDKFGYSLCIVDTRGSHASLTDEYASIPSEMKTVANFFNKNFIREVSYSDILDNIVELRSKCSDRAVLRALHVIKENERVDKQVEALNNGDIDEFLKWIKASGDSSYKYLQNIYATSDYANQAVSLGIMISEDLLAGKGAVRVHGGGFAGTIQAFVPNELVANYKEGIEKVFGKDACKVLKIRPMGGYQVL